MGAKTGPSQRRGVEVLALFLPSPSQSQPQFTQLPPPLLPPYPSSTTGVSESDLCFQAILPPKARSLRGLALSVSGVSALDTLGDLLKVVFFAVESSGPCQPSLSTAIEASKRQEITAR